MNIRNTKRAAAAAVSLAVAASIGFGVSAFGVDDSKEVRQADFITGLTDVRSAGHYEFLEEGLHAYTDDNSSLAKVALYFAPRGGDTAIPDTASQDWYGTDPEPGKQIVFDTDTDRSNAGSFNILVGEPVYGDDWWQSGGQARAAANGYTCPETGGGFGGDCHGTLAQWKVALATDKPTHQVYALGFSLGSGIKGDGVLRSQTYGSNEYIFTDETNVAPVTPEAHTQSAPVVANLTWANVNKKTDVTFTSNNPAANDTLRGTKVAWRITVDGVGKFSSTMGWGENEHYVDTYPTSDPNHVVRVYKNGVLFSTRTVTTN